MVSIILTLTKQEKEDFEGWRRLVTGETQLKSSCILSSDSSLKSSSLGFGFDEKKFFSSGFVCFSQCIIGWWEVEGGSHFLHTIFLSMATLHPSTCRPSDLSLRHFLQNPLESRTAILAGTSNFLKSGITVDCVKPLKTFTSFYWSLSCFERIWSLVSCF